MRRLALLLVLLVPGLGHAQGANQKASLLEYIRGRDDLPAAQRKAWETAIKTRFGGVALDEDRGTNAQISVAKSILSTAIFIQADPKQAAAAAFEGYRGALGYVPPPLAIHYQVMVLEGRRPKASMESLTFKFPQFYTDELAPDIVKFWETSLANKSIPDAFVAETEEAMHATKKLMRPLLADKLKLIVRLTDAQKRVAAKEKAQIQTDIADLEAEIAECFKGVAANPRALDRNVAPRERLEVVVDELDAKQKAEINKELEQLDEIEKRSEADAQKAEAEAKKAAVIARAAEDEAKKAADSQKRAEAEQEKRRLEEQRAASDQARREATEKRLAAKALAEAEAKKRVAADRHQAEEAERALAAKRRAESERKRANEDHRRSEAGEERAEIRLEKAKIAERLESVIGAWLGTPYLWGGTQKKSGTDCSGFTKGVEAEGFSIELPRISRDQFRTGTPVEQGELESGDLIFFDTADGGSINHVGVYAGAGRFAHASSSRGVVYEELGKTYYQKAYRGARRVLVTD